MKRPKNLIQTRVTQTSPPEREPGEIDLTNLPVKEFKEKVINILMEMQRKMQEITDKVQRETTEIKQSLEGLRCRTDEKQEAINGEETRKQDA